MTQVSLVVRNLWRNRTRSLLTIGSLGVSLFLFTMLSAAVESMKSVASDAAEHLRLVVHQKTTVTKLLPLSHGPKLGAVPGVRRVCGMRWFGGRLENSQEQFPSMAVDPDTFPNVFSDFELTEVERNGWHARRTAAVVGAGLARRIGCGPGNRVVLAATVPPYLKLDFDVVGITHAAAYPNVFVFRLDYLVDALRSNPMMPPEHDDAVNLFWLQVSDPSDLDSVRRAVDATFAAGTDATMTELEEAFVTQFMLMFGDIPALVQRVGLVVLASMLLVVGNTLSSTIRERIGELAVLKAVGYSTSRLVALLLAEAGLLGLLGSTGCWAAFLAFGFFDGMGLSMPYFPVITVSPTVVLFGTVISIVLNLAAAALPAARLARLSVTATLRDIA